MSSSSSSSEHVRKREEDVGGDGIVDELSERVGFWDGKFHVLGDIGAAAEDGLSAFFLNGVSLFALV